MSEYFTPVIFRLYDGQPTALFPTIPADNNGSMCLSYARIGQHGGASPNYSEISRPAKLEEYFDLLGELYSLGYEKLKVYKRLQSWMHEERRELSRIDLDYYG